MLIGYLTSNQNRKLKIDPIGYQEVLLGYSIKGPEALLDNLEDRKRAWIIWIMGSLAKNPHEILSKRILVR